MVFFIIACHKKDHSEEQVEHIVQNNCNSGKGLGELFKVSVQPILDVLG